MYSALEIRRPSGRLIAMIESFDKVRKVSYTEDELLKDSLQRVLDGGIDTVIPTRSERICINTNPADPDFLEQLMQYLQLSFDYLCTYKVEQELKPKEVNVLIFTTAINSRPVMIGYLEGYFQEWSKKSPSLYVPFISIKAYQEMTSSITTSSWIIAE